MDTLKTVIVSLVVAVLVVGAGFTFLKPGAPGELPKLGSAASADLPFQYLNWGGVRTWNTGAALTQNASTTCSIQSPTSTSTLVFAGIKLDTASTSATIVEIGKAAGPQATTTLLGTKYNIGANALAMINASTSPSAGALEVFSPGQWLNFKIGGGISTGDAAGTGFVPVGRCQAQFEEYPTL